ncbi:MAG: signal peptide peptidase SppA [Bacteroidota bacterium]
MSKTAKWILGILGILILLFGLIALSVVSWLFSDEEDTSVSTSGSKIAVIELKEKITGSEDIVRQFKKYRENNSVKAIVFRVESPGGGVVASQEIYEEAKKTRDGGKPVIVSMGSEAASGGYYVSCGASKIVANPGTLTGSIGVIMEFLHYHDLMAKIGLDETTIKTGKLKDAGSPFRKTTVEEKAYFKMLVADVYDQFVDVVAKERKLDRKYVEKYADGRVFTGRQAVELGFVDTLGTMEDAVNIAALLGGIKGRPTVVKEVKHKSFMDRIFGDAASDLSQLKNDFLHQPVLQYKFTSPN